MRKTPLEDLLNISITPILKTCNISFYTTFHSVTMITSTMALVNTHRLFW